ncbi:exosome complex exonuclease Rrp41 [Nanoarchaeota archaeon]
MTYTKRSDGRKMDEMRKISAKVGVIPRADGSAEFSFGDTKAVAAVYGPKHLHPQFLQNPQTGILRCFYDMMSFSVTDRIRPGKSRRSQEISHVSAKALQPVVMLTNFPNTVVDVFINITQADAGTRTAGINAASLALAHAGIPMKDLIGSISVGKVGDKLVVDLTKEEEDYAEDGEKMATDIPLAFTLRDGKVSLLQLDGKISPQELVDAAKLGKKAAEKILEVQRKALMEGGKQ